MSHERRFHPTDYDDRREVIHREHIRILARQPEQIVKQAYLKAGVWKACVLPNS